MGQNIINSYSAMYLDAILLGDRARCKILVSKYLNENSSVIDLYEEVFKPALYEVGRLWEMNKISVAAEHLATAITEGLLSELFEQNISNERLNKKVVVACVVGEHHQVGIKMVADTFEICGWESFFLGSGIPVQELIKYIHEVKPDVLSLSLSVYFNYQNFIQMINCVRLEFPELKILVGGQAFNFIQNEMTKEFKDVVYLPDLYLLKQYIKSISN